MPTEDEELSTEGRQETQSEIFQHATAPEPPAAEPEPVASAPAEGAQPETEQPRDGHGRWAKQEKPAEQPAKTPQAPTADAPADKQAQQDHRIPLRELLDEREKRQRHEQENSALRRQLQEFSAQLRQMQEKPAEKPDFYADPDAYLKQTVDPLRQEMAREIGEMREGFSRMMAIQTHGEESVNAAFAALEQQMQTGTGQYDYARIMRSQHPFGELVKWHQTHQTIGKIGGDLDGFLKKRDDELLNDPAFMQKVADKLRAQANGGQVTQGGKPSPNVQLPPSLSRVSSAAPRTAGEDDMDISEAGLFRQALS